MTVNVAIERAQANTPCRQEEKASALADALQEVACNFYGTLTDALAVPIRLLLRSSTPSLS